MAMSLLKTKIDGFIKVRTIPPVLNALLAELENSESSRAAMAKIISQDISLTARLLRVSNSAYYRRQNEVTTVQQAIGILGTRAVMALSLSVSLFEMTGGLERSGLIDLKELWRHNLEVAVLSSQIAGHIKGIQPEEAFACGLLHDLGIVFFVQMMPTEYAEVLRLAANNDRLEQIEKEIMGITHSQAGAQVASAWNLPAIFAEAIANHHAGNIEPRDNSESSIWKVINLAHRYSRHGIDLNSIVSIENIKNRLILLENMGLKPETMASLLAEFSDRVINMASYLDIDIGDPWSLFSRANAELGELYDLYEKAIVDNSRLRSDIERIIEKNLAAEAMGNILQSLAQLLKKSHDIIRKHALAIESAANQGLDDAYKDDLARSLVMIERALADVDMILDELCSPAESKAPISVSSLRISEIHQKIKARMKLPA